MSLLISLAGFSAHADENPGRLTISGELTGNDHESYQEVPFEVPPGITRITVSVEYERDNRTVVDLGLFDPERFRGWSGGNKSTFTVAESYATPSYLPGPVISGTWKLILGVPNIREGSVAKYRAEILLESGAMAGARPFATIALNDSPAWYRGELHAHTGHSDGSCRSQSGESVPCPVYRSVEAAAALGLDFLAITEHNATSHHQALQELQIAFDQMVLMAGREITTFFGHSNIFGTTDFIDFRATNAQMDSILRDVGDDGGLVSLNHPGLPSGEACMGCGWVADTDYSLVHAIEIINGSVIDSSNGEIYGPLSGIPFWQDLLNKGYRITGIAGSDNHSADLDAASGRLSALGQITTVIHAASLSQADLMQGIRQGRVFVDLEGSRDRVLDMTATSAEQTAIMGENLQVSSGDEIEINVNVEHAPDSSIILYRNGVAMTNAINYTHANNSMTAQSVFTSTGQREWFRTEVIDQQNNVLMLSNPVYINFDI
ncbi:MAG: CehA/McbA family metallohydrolase [Pseudohongiella sp.]|uniref:CehA/McbA family metallohydrolase n=1 Tax=Pseudohongiella sp. TaxID=1979412 RepID=UPI0034A070BB